MEEAAIRFALVDINEILKTLPHRYPMLLIDRVINIRTDYSGIGIKNVTFNEMPFLGHFPERPVYPGVMMIEAMAQTAGVIGIKSVVGTAPPRAVYFLTIDKCKFRKPVLPGDTIEYHMRSIGRRKAMWWFQGDAKVDGVTVAEADVGVVTNDQTVDFTVDAYPTRTFHGKVVQVRNAPITVQNVVTYDTVIGVSNADLKLKPGMTANVSIIIAHRDDALKVGNSALRYRPPEGTVPEAKASPAASRSPGSGPRPREAAARERRIERTIYVLLPGERQPKAVQIKTGISDNISTEVTEGLHEGDRVVVGAISGGTAPNPASTNPFGGGRRF